MPIVQGLQAAGHVDEGVPDFSLLELCRILLVFRDPVEEVAAICVVHDYTEAACVLVEESLLVGNNVWRLNRRKNSNLIKCVFLLFLRQLLNFNLYTVQLTFSDSTYLLQCILLPV